MAKKTFDSDKFVEQRREDLRSFYVDVMAGRGAAPAIRDGGLIALQSLMGIIPPVIDARTAKSSMARWWHSAVRPGFAFVVEARPTESGVMRLGIRCDESLPGLYINRDGTANYSDTAEGLAIVELVTNGRPVYIGDTTPGFPGTTKTWAIGCQRRHELHPADVSVRQLVKAGIIPYQQAEEMMRAFNAHEDRRLALENPDCRAPVAEWERHATPHTGCDPTDGYCPTPSMIR